MSSKKLPPPDGGCRGDGEHWPGGEIGMQVSIMTAPVTKEELRACGTFDEIIEARHRLVHRLGGRGLRAVKDDWSNLGMNYGIEEPEEGTGLRRYMVDRLKDSGWASTNDPDRELSALDVHWIRWIWSVRYDHQLKKQGRLAKPGKNPFKWPKEWSRDEIVGDIAYILGIKEETVRSYVDSHPGFSDPDPAHLGEFA